MKKIKLTKNKIALVDDEDYNMVSQYKWSCRNNGSDNLYAVRTTKDKKSIYMHRQILKVCNKNTHVDHINGNSLDNRKCNLRTCSNEQNRRNSKLNKRNKVGYKGVRTRDNINKFAAYINYKGRFYHLGYYDTAIEAAKARDKKAIELHGKFAKLNFPKEKL